MNSIAPSEPCESVRAASSSPAIRLTSSALALTAASNISWPHAYSSISNAFLWWIKSSVLSGKSRFFGRERVTLKLE
jgi:hypothetical protein